VLRKKRRLQPSKPAAILKTDTDLLYPLDSREVAFKIWAIAIKEIKLVVKLRHVPLGVAEKTRHELIPAFFERFGSREREAEELKENLGVGLGLFEQIGFDSSEPSDPVWVEWRLG